MPSETCADSDISLIAHLDFEPTEDTQEPCAHEGCNTEASWKMMYIMKCKHTHSTWLICTEHYVSNRKWIEDTNYFLVCQLCHPHTFVAIDDVVFERIVSQ